MDEIFPKEPLEKIKKGSLYTFLKEILLYFIGIPMIFIKINENVLEEIPDEATEENL